MRDALKAARDALLKAEAALDAVYAAACKSEIVVRDVATTCGGGTYGLWDRADRAADECGLAIAQADAALAVVADGSPFGRDADWALAMAEALGTDSGFSVPIVPSPDAFRELFAAVRSRLGSHADVEDAERYRWLRDVAQPGDWESIYYVTTPETTDAAIDLARKEQT